MIYIFIILLLVVIVFNCYNNYLENADINIIEDSAFIGNITLNSSDPDGTINLYEIAYEDTSKVHCTITDSKLGIVPAANLDPGWVRTLRCGL